LPQRIWRPHSFPILAREKIKEIQVVDASPHKVSGRTAAGATVLIASKLVARCLDLATIVVLGRLLSPADFGLVAIAMSIVMVVEAILELPVGQAVVRLSVVTKAHYDTAFTISSLRGAVVALILFSLSWPLAQIYGDDRLIGLVCALAISPAARSVLSAGLIERSKNLDFKAFVLCEFAGKCASFVVSVGLAWGTRSYWAIAAGTIAFPIVLDIVSYVVAPYRPKFTLREWHEFAGFIGWSTASQAVNAFNWQMDQLILGRLISRPELGRFSMATNLAILPTQAIVFQVLNPLMIAFSLIRNDSRRLAAAYRNSAATVVAVGLPMMVGMSLIAEPMIRLILGGQWLEATPILRLLALAMVPSLFTAPLAPLSMTLGKTSIFLRLSLIEFAVRLPIVLIGALYYGIAGVLAARLITAILVAGCSMFAVRELIGLPIRTQVFGPWRSMLSCVFMALAVMPFHDWLSGITVYGPLAFGLAVVVSVAALVYASSIFVLWRLAGCPDGFESKVVGFLLSQSKRIL
jgi:O-antigen/teichoic acid export membrane protein